MELSPHYESDLLFFFDARPMELALYQALFHQLEVLFPQVRVKIQKTQISFYGRHLFAAASLPIRRRKGWPEHCLVVTIGLPFRLDSPRVAVAVESYPGRWTHHILVTREEEIDGQLLGWLMDAFAFSERK